MAWCPEYLYHVLNVFVLLCLLIYSHLNNFSIFVIIISKTQIKSVINTLVTFFFKAFYDPLLGRGLPTSIQVLILNATLNQKSQCASKSSCPLILGRPRRRRPVRQVTYKCNTDEYFGPLVPTGHGVRTDVIKYLSKSGVRNLTKGERMSTYVM